MSLEENKMPKCILKVAELSLQATTSKSPLIQHVCQYHSGHSVGIFCKYHNVLIQLLRNNQTLPKLLNVDNCRLSPQTKELA